MTIKGTSGDDTLTGTAGADSFNMAQAGNDTVSGLGGNDVFSFGAFFTAADHIDGGDGIDTLKLDGDYSSALVFQAATMVNVEKITLSAGNNYNLQMLDANVAAGQTLQVNAGALGAANTFTFFDNTESDGSLVITGGAGDDTIEGGKFHNDLYGGGGNDEIVVLGGTNTVDAGDGDDIISITGAFSSTSKFDGGTGSNQIFFDGDFSGGQVLGRNAAINIGDFGFSAGFSYKITLGNGITAAGHTLPFYANSLTATDTLNISAVHLTAGNVYLQGGAGNDKLVGGAGNDGFEGRGGHDVMTGGAGSDSFYYNNVADSTSSTFDRITDFDASTDKIRGMTVNAIDTAVNGGTVTGAHFDADLANILDATHLHAGDAVLFTPSVGYLSGHTLLVVDANGTAGYQAGADYVIDVTGMTGTLATSSF